MKWHVQWCIFNVNCGVRQGGILSPIAFLSSFFDAVELEYRYVLLLSEKFLTTKHQSFVSAVHEHFGDIV